MAFSQIARVFLNNSDESDRNIRNIRNIHLICEQTDLTFRKTKYALNKSVEYNNNALCLLK